MPSPTPPRAVLSAGLLSVGLLLAGCANSGPFPSLKPRPMELALAQSDAPREPAPVPANPQLVARAEALLATIRSSQGAFDAAYRTASAAAGRAGPVGSDSWIEAQQILSRVEGARTPVVETLAELDALIPGEIEAGRAINAADREAVESAMAQAQGIANAQQAQVARINARLSPS